MSLSLGSSWLTIRVTHPIRHRHHVPKWGMALRGSEGMTDVTDFGPMWWLLSLVEQPLLAALS